MEIVSLLQFLNLKNICQSEPFSNSLYLLLLLLLILFMRHNKSCVKLKLAPSPPKLPIIGNLHQLGKFPHRSFRALSDKYGPLMLLNLGQIPTLIVSSPDTVTEIVNNHDVVFSGRPKTTATNILFYGNKTVAFSPYREYWKETRKVCVVELLSLKRVQSFEFVREQEVGNLVNKVRKACLGGTSVNLSQMLIGASNNNIVSRCVLGQGYKAEDGSISRLGELANAVAMQLMEFSVGDFFPSLRWIDVIRGFVGRLRSTFREFDAFNDRVVQEHKAARKLGGVAAKMEDFVDVLLRLQLDCTLDFELTQDHLKAILQDMFTAGIETTSTISEWLMAELVRKPRVMKEPQEEVRRVVGQQEKVGMDDINQMDYLKCVVKRNLRLHPPAPLLAPRETTANVEIGGYHVPVKTTVLINAWAIHRHPSLWDKPEEFIPERFENTPVDFNVQDFHFVPFGFGRRRCPGLALGIFSVEHLIANLLYWFDWKLPNGVGLLPEDLDMCEVYGIKVHKKVPLEILPTLYSP